MVKKTKYISSTIVILMVMTIFVAFILKNNLIPKGHNLWNNIWKETSSSKTIDNMSTIPNEINDFTTQKNTNALWDNKYVNLKGLSFTVNEASISKDRGNLPIPNTYKNDIKLDENGTVLSEHSYIIIKITITNTSDEKTTVSLSNIRLNIYQEDKLIGAEELLVTDVNTNKQNNRDYFHYDILPEESISFLFGYIISDDFLDKKQSLVVYISPNGGGDPQNVGYIKINDLLWR